MRKFIFNKTTYLTVGSLKKAVEKEFDMISYDKHLDKMYPTVHVVRKQMKYSDFFQEFDPYGYIMGYARYINEVLNDDEICKIEEI